MRTVRTARKAGGGQQQEARGRHERQNRAHTGKHQTRCATGIPRRSAQRAARKASLSVQNSLPAGIFAPVHRPEAGRCHTLPRNAARWKVVKWRIVLRRSTDVHSFSRSAHSFSRHREVAPIARAHSPRRERPASLPWQAARRSDVVPDISKDRQWCCCRPFERRRAARAAACIASCAFVF